jgi:BirA family biotin operon repressor/biotin-[acetyl-CoA-carboxylase] ligase
MTPSTLCGDPVPEALRAAMTATQARRATFGERIVYFEETDSTNDVAAELAGHGAASGTLVLAASQRRGRGRHGRTWFSPPGAGLYFSLILRPRSASRAPGTMLLTLAAGVAMSQGIERASGLSPQIKWPNDLVVEAPTYASQTRQRRKLAGMLAEGSVASDEIQHVILGIGINVRNTAYPPELADRVTSLERELGRDVEPFDVLGECLASFAACWRDLLDGRHVALLDEWRRRSPSAIGMPVVAHSADGPVRGTTAGLQDDGSLAIETAKEVLRVSAGEVQWL